MYPYQTITGRDILILICTLLWAAWYFKMAALTAGYLFKKAWDPPLWLKIVLIAFSMIWPMVAILEWEKLIEKENNWNK